MASNYTKHLGLCQWEATDQVLRTDFNEDNTKVDAVLKEQAEALAAEETAREVADNILQNRLDNLENKQGLHLLLSHTYTGEDCEKITVELSGIDWSQWNAVHLLVLPGLDSGSYRVFLENVELIKSTNKSLYASFFPRYLQFPDIHGIVFCSDINYQILPNKDIPWNTVTHILVNRYGQYDFLKDGTTIKLWGEY